MSEPHCQSCAKRERDAAAKPHGCYTAYYDTSRCEKCKADHEALYKVPQPK